MKKIELLSSYGKSVVAGLAILVFAACSFISTTKGNKTVPSSPQAASDSSIPCQGCFFTNSIPLGPNVPGDAPIFGNQFNANCFAWWEFIALNWPSNGNDFGKPGDVSPVQWETYMTKEVMFPQGGTAPPPWGDNNLSLAPQYLKSFRFMGSHPKVLTATSKADDNISSFDPSQAFPFNGPNWLGAQNNTNVWYEIKLNKDIYNFVVSNGYYNADSQLAAVNKNIPVVFPKGVYNGATGAIELKAAWMEVTDTNNVKWKRYKLSKGLVVDVVTGKLRPVTLALVGLLILHKTEKEPTWVWATFEHVDNVPGATNSSGDYNFYNPNCQPQKLKVPLGCSGDSSTSVTVGCTPNTPPPYYLCNNGPGPVPIQVIRVTPIDGDASSINAKIQPGLANAFPGTVWQYYQLVNVVWSTSPAQDPTTAVGDTIPRDFPGKLPSVPVANTVLESYIQTNTCIDCHRYSTIAPTEKVENPKWSGDFSFAIGTATYSHNVLKYLKSNYSK